MALLIALLIAISAHAATNTQITIPLICGGLGYDATTAVFYASARTNAGTFSNCLLRIEPFTGAMTVVTNFDSVPGTLAVSAEHRALYVALPDQNAVRRFDLTTQTMGPPFNVAGGARQLEVIPGLPERLVLLRRDGSVALYENGTMRPGPSGYDFVSLLCTGADGTRVYGFDLNTTASTFWRFVVGTGGLALMDARPPVGLPGGNMRFAGGRLYAGDGWVADPEANTLLGQFPVGSANWRRYVAPDLARHRVFILRLELPYSVVYACEPTSFRLIDSGVITNTTWPNRLTSDDAYVHDFQRWGEDGFVCRTYDKVLISRSTIVPSGPPADLGMTLRTTNTVVTNLQVFSYDIVCTNHGPIAATNAVLRFDLPPETVFVAATNTRGTSILSSNTVICSMSTLATNMTASVRVTVRVQTTNLTALLAKATFSSSAVDPNEDNNFAVLLTTANWRPGEEQFNAVASIVPDDAMWSSLTRRFYFVFDRNAGPLAQMIIGFDPVLGVFDRPVFLPHDPQRIALSADGNWAEVAMSQSGELRRLNLLTGQITTETSPTRWQEIQSRTDAQKDQEGIRFTADRAVSIVDNQLLGTFSLVDVFEPDVPARRFYQFGLVGAAAGLRVVDLDTFRLLHAVPLPLPPAWGFGSLCRWGETGFLLRGGEGFVVWRSRLVPFAAPSDLRTLVSTKPTQTITGNTFTVAAIVANTGPNPATNVTLRLWLPPQATLLNVMGNTGVLSTNDSTITLSINRLAVSSNGLITASLRATNAAVLLTTAHATSQSLDTNWSNDVAVCSTLITNRNGWPARDTAVTFPLPVNDLIYEPVSQRLFASLGSSAGMHGNSVVSIDPGTGLMDSLWFVGSEPQSLAASDDGQFLYVSLDGAARVSRLRLSDGIEDFRFSVVHSHSYGQDTSDMVVQPGHPDTVALVRYHGDRRLVIYRGGQVLPETVYAGFDIQVIAFNETGDALFAGGNQSSDFLFSVMRVTTNGVQLLGQYEGLLAGFAESFRYEGGLIFGTRGTVFEPITRIPRGLLPGVRLSGGIAPHVAAGRAYGMTPSGGKALVRAYEINSMTLLNEQTFDAATDFPFGLQRCGEDRLAYRSASSVVILRSSLVPTGPAADLQVGFRASPAAAQLNEPFTIQLTVTNAGPSPAANCVAAVGLPAGLTLLETSCDGGWIENGVWYACVPGALAPGQSVPWTLTLASTTPGLKFIQAFVQADITDAHAENDVTSCFIPVGLELGAGSRDEMPLPVRTLIYSPARGRLYGAIPAGVGPLGNSVIEIDPATSKVRGPLFVGSEPVALAVTDNGQYLYVSLDGGGAMRQVDLASWSAGSLFPAGAGVEQAVALAGVTNGLVLTHGSDARVYVGGTRTSFVDGPISRLLRGTGSRLYGFDPTLLTMPIVNLSAGPAFITISSQWTDQFFGPGVDLRFASGRLFSNRGDVLDPETEQRLGQFAWFSPVNAFAPEPDGSRLYTIQDGSLQVWETANYQFGATTNLSPAPSTATSDLLRWGADGLAFLEDGFFPVWIRSPLVRTAPGADTDRDGMPDEWESSYGLNPNIVSDAGADPDHDGVANRDEYLRGTNPQFAEGPLRLFVTATSPDGLHLRFAGRSGHSYRLEHTATLSPADWQSIGTSLPGQQNMISVSWPVSAPKGFLRVVDETSP